MFLASAVAGFHNLIDPKMCAKCCPNSEKDETTLSEFLDHKSVCRLLHVVKNGLEWVLQSISQTQAGVWQCLDMLNQRCVDLNFQLCAIPWGPWGVDVFLSKPLGSRRLRSQARLTLAGLHKERWKAALSQRPSMNLCTETWRAYLSHERFSIKAQENQ